MTIEELHDISNKIGLAHANAYMRIIEPYLKQPMSLNDFTTIVIDSNAAAIFNIIEWMREQTIQLILTKDPQSNIKEVKRTMMYKAFAQHIITLADQLDECPPTQNSNSTLN
jgi:hypothetical protein